MEGRELYLILEKMLESMLTTDLRNLVNVDSVNFNLVEAECPDNKFENELLIRNFLML